MNSGSHFNAQRARKLYAPLVPTLKRFLDDGYSYSQMAHELNRMGVRNGWDNTFSRQLVHLTVSRLKKQGLL
jgi:hypothetical protein